MTLLPLQSLHFPEVLTLSEVFWRWLTNREVYKLLFWRLDWGYCFGRWQSCCMKGDDFPYSGKDDKGVSLPYCGV